MEIIQYLYEDHKGDSVYKIIFSDGNEEVVEVCDGTVFPTTVLSKEEEKELIGYHFGLVI